MTYQGDFKRYYVSFHDPILGWEEYGIDSTRLFVQLADAIAKREQLNHRLPYSDLREESRYGVWDYNTNQEVSVPRY
jgi:hypothetical protein